MTKIEWADLTINPIVGCTKCSPGCDNCYAERFAARHAGNPKTAKRYLRVTTGGKWNGATDINFSCFRHLPETPSRIFVGSMGDVFHESVLQDHIDRLLNVLSNFPQHIFMLLTKRPKRMRSAINSLGRRWLTSVLPPADIAEAPRSVPAWPLPNVWLGVTVENQEQAEERIPVLLSIPAAKRFVSIEPILEDICLCGLFGYWMLPDGREASVFPAKGKEYRRLLDWVIVGAETGPGARRMEPEWALSVRRQCRAAGVPFFFKKMSGKTETPDDLRVREVPE